MPSSASQAMGAARAHSKNVKRRKTAGAAALVDAARYGEAAARAAVISALSELTEPRLRRAMHEAGLDPDSVTRGRNGVGAI